MAYVIELDNTQWGLIRDLFESKRGPPAAIPRRQIVDAMLFIARTGCEWRYLPARHGPLGAVWQQWLRWRRSGVWALAMDRLARLMRVQHGRKPTGGVGSRDASSRPRRVRTHCCKVATLSYLLGRV